MTDFKTKVLIQALESHADKFIESHELKVDRNGQCWMSTGDGKTQIDLRLFVVQYTMELIRKAER